MSFKPVSSCEGRIERLLVTLPPLPDLAVDQYYADIENTFKDREMVIRYRNYAPPRQDQCRKVSQEEGNLYWEEKLNEVMNERRILTVHGEPEFHHEYLGEIIEFLHSQAPIANSEWAQDPFCVLEDGLHRSVFLQPLYSKRYMDKFISLWLAARPELNMLIRPTELILEGGNILAGDGFVMIGKNTLAQNVLRRLRKERRKSASRALVKEITKAFEVALGEKVIWVGFEHSMGNWKDSQTQTYQPAFHIDLYITLGGIDHEGRNLVFVGDPGLAFDLLQGRIPRERLHIHPGAKANFDHHWSFWESVVSISKRFTSRFKVVRIPLFIHQDVLMSFNNGLIESYNGEKVAFLPDYEVNVEQDRFENLNAIFEILKEETEAIFYKNGFAKVNWIGPGNFFRRLSLMRGSLHCITKVLKRSPA